MTATPVDSSGKGMGPWAQAIECAAPTTQLLRDGWLCPVKCYAPERQRGRGGKFKRGIAGDLVESWKQYGSNLPTVLFTSRVKHSMDAVEAYNSAGIPAAHVDADTPDEERDRIYDSLETGQIKIVSNVGIIGEGVDVPCLGCCQWFMDVSGRVKWLQGNGRIMRPYAGKECGIVIDHSGSVFRHGFPDEDQEWTLDGDVDAEYRAKHDRGETEKAFYCKHCERTYHGQMKCPDCGRLPVKPPRSIFAPPDLDSTNELLTEAERGAAAQVDSRDEKIRHWKRCLAVAANRNGTFKMASVIFRQKYREWPEREFPYTPNWDGMDQKVADVYPAFVRRKREFA